jgi:hypothetical protein
MKSDLRVEIVVGRLTGWGAQTGTAGTIKRWLSVASQSGGRIISNSQDIDYDTALTIYSSNLDDDIQDTIYLEVLTENQGDPQILEFVLLSD